MALSRSIQELLKRAGLTSADDDDALDDLARQLLEAVILDPDAPEELKEQASRLLNAPGDAETSDDATN